MTLTAWKRYFAESWKGTQRGANDIARWESDARVRRAVEKARTWEALCEVAPPEYASAAANRCRRQDL